MIPIGSILVALGLPVYGLWRNQTDHPLKQTFLVSISSFLFCCMAIMMEIHTIKRRLFAGDIGGIEDTIDAVLTLCGILIVFTLLLNGLLLGLTYAFDEKSGGTSNRTFDGKSDHLAGNPIDSTRVPQPAYKPATSGQNEAEGKR